MSSVGKENRTQQYSHIPGEVSLSVNEAHLFLVFLDHPLMYPTKAELSQQQTRINFMLLTPSRNSQILTGHTSHATRENITKLVKACSFWCLGNMTIQNKVAD